MRKINAARLAVIERHEGFPLEPQDPVDVWTIGCESYQRLRILEETSHFADGSVRLEFSLQGLRDRQWCTLGMSHTLEDARTALLFHTARAGCWVC